MSRATELLAMQEESKIDPGLLSWVKNYIIARQSGNPKMAKEMKKNIDKAIKKEKLDPKEVYMYFGDPDDHRNKGKDVDDFVK